MPKAKSSTSSRHAAMEQAAWMNQAPNPLPVFKKGELVEVYRGAGWSKASVIDSTPKGCQVSIFQADKLTSIYDARCIRPCKKKSDD